MNSPRIKDENSKKSPRQGSWPDPNTEAFRRPVRTLQEDHLHISRDTDPYSVPNFLKQGYQIYFVRNSDDEDDVISPESKVPESTYYKCTSKYDCLNLVNNNDDIDINNSDLNNKDVMDNNIIDLNDVIDERMWGKRCRNAHPLVLTIIMM